MQCDIRGAFLAYFAAKCSSGLHCGFLAQHPLWEPEYVHQSPDRQHSGDDVKS
jgi:hypothetical protein